MSTPEEIVLISRVLLANDERAFARLMKKYLRPVRRYFLVQTGGNEALSDDLTQETFIRVWKGLDSYKRLASLGTWIYRIAYTTFQNHLAASKHYVSIDDETILPMVQSLIEEPSYVDSDKLVALHRAIGQLGSSEKACITLFYLEEMSIKEIMSVTNMAEGSVKSALSRGREHLRTFLTQAL